MFLWSQARGICRNLWEVQNRLLVSTWIVIIWNTEYVKI